REKDQIGKPRPGRAEKKRQLASVKV
ncbi:MAG: hypothetical protein ACI9W4_002351, partial [Rhodothermales bacterium]